MIIDEPKHYQKHATTRNPYIVLFGFVTVAGQIGPGIMNKGNTTANCDSLGVGIYRITQLDGYIDLNYPASNGYIISLVSSGNGSQIFYFGDDSVVYYRHKWNIWTPWKKISFNP